MPIAAEPTVAPQHSPHGEQDSAVISPEIDIQGEPFQETQTTTTEQTSTTPTTATIEPVVASPMEVAPMVAGPAAVAPMEGNLTTEDEAGVAAEQEAPAQEFSSGDSSAPPSDADAPPSAPSDVGGSGGGDAGASDGDTEPTAEAEQTKSEEEEQEGKEETGAAGDAPEGPVHTTPRTPEEDPNFQAAVARKDDTVTEQQTHEEPAAAAGAAQASSTSPANERESMAEAGQVNEMDQEEPGVFDAASFKAMLMEAIAAILPKNNDEADKFADSGKVDKVKNKATSQVESEKESAAGDIEQKTQEEPDTNSVPERQVQPLAPQDPGPAPVDIAAGSAMPPTRGAAEVNAPLDQNVDEVEQAKADAEVTDEQLLRGNEPSFTDAVNKSDEAKQHAHEAPVQFRQQEQETLASSEAGAQAAGESQLTAMHHDRTGVMAQVSADQQNTATSDTSVRQKVADHINGIYEQTKTDVEDILTTLDTSVETMFDKAADKATNAFENLVDRRMSAYKSRRYSGLIGKGRWVKDLFAGLPDEANRFFTEGRNLYLEIMDGELTLIAEHVAKELTAAKTRIQKGKQDIQDYVVSLPKNLQQEGKEAADAINSKFDELKESVIAKGEELVDTIAGMYQESLEAVDARIEEMKAANRGLIDMALGALIGVIETILKIKNLLFELLAAALEVIGTIISDPIGFLSNLIEGVKQGINNFFSNILNNVMTGLIEWLTGSLGNVGITMPDNLFSLSGIFDLVTQILGLTWDYFRDKAVKMLGEPLVSAMETGFELFQIIRKDGVAGLWEHIKEQFTDLKEMVMDAIRDMIVTKVIEAGIKWILGLLNPAGAFIKAAMLIIDVVKFFVERAAQIFELVQAFIEGIKAVASGNVSAVAKAIEKALVKAIPVLIGFLAALVGVTGLTSKVQKIIKKVRKRIDKAINKIIKKAKRAFKNLVKKGKKKVKGAVQRLLNWWKKDKKFKDKKGKDHRLYFKGKGKKAKLYVRSKEKPLEDKIKALKKDPDPVKSGVATTLEIKYNSLISEIQTKSERDLTEAEQKAFQTKIAKGLQEISEDLKKVMDDESELPPSAVTYQKDGQKAGSVTAWPLTNKPGNTKGTKPGEEPPGWDHVRSFDEVKDEKASKKRGKTIYTIPNWVRFHILNQKLHGPGVKWNLIPTSQKDNINYENKVEDPVKKALKAEPEGIFYFKANVAYREPKEGAPYYPNFPDKVHVEAGSLNENDRKEGTYTEGSSIVKKDFDIEIPPKPPRNRDSPLPLIIMESGRDQLRTHTKFKSEAYYIVAAPASINTVLGFKNYFLRSKGRLSFDTTISYLRKVADSLGDVKSKEDGTTIIRKVSFFEEGENESLMRGKINQVVRSMERFDEQYSYDKYLALRDEVMENKGLNKGQIRTQLAAAMTSAGIPLTANGIRDWYRSNPSPYHMKVVFQKLREMKR
ncbi:MAG: hypothetical protein R8G66_05715 [Cytophagales bacterium]|nr:hypothetical protein [Cytophagales bacterium]